MGSQPNAWADLAEGLSLSSGACSLVFPKGHVKRQLGVCGGGLQLRESGCGRNGQLGEMCGQAELHNICFFVV